MLSRRDALTLGAVLAITPFVAEAQGGQSLPQIGMLGAGNRAREIETYLRQLGWVDGRNVTIVRQFTTTYDANARAARELVKRGVDVIVATNAPATKAAREATQTIPIVMAPAGDPVAAGFVASLANPGANVTGVAIMHTELSGKRLELLAEVLPGVKRLAVLANPQNPSTPAMLQETDARARALGIDVVRLEATTIDQLAAAFAAMAELKVRGVVVLGDPFFFTETRRVVALASRHRLAGVYEWREMAEDGGLLAYGPERGDLSRRAAAYVDKILKGAKPADLAVEQPTKFELAVNLKTAKALGLVIPPAVVLRADHVIA